MAHKIILIFLALLASSQHTTDIGGSIFDQTENYEAPPQQPDQNQGNSLSSVESPSQQTVTNEYSAPQILLDELKQLEELQDNLVEEQEQLQQDIENLERLLVNSVQKVEQYRLTEDVEEQQEQEPTVVYREVPQQVVLEPIQPQVEEKEDDDEDYQLEISDAMIYIIGLGFLFLLLHAVRLIVGFSIDSFLYPALYNLFVDVTILALLCTLTSVLDYYNVFDEDKIDLEYLSLGIAFFILAWLLLGLALILAAQSFARTWMKQENKCIDTQALLVQYDTAYIEYSQGVGNSTKFRMLRNDVQYGVMRQLFICPVYLPPVTESYLRSDFDFSDYLKRCLADILAKGFQISWLGYSIVVAGIIIWRAVLIAENFYVQMICMWLIPALILLLSIFSIRKLYHIYYQLVPYVFHRDEINLPADNFNRNPEMNIGATKEPPYLQGVIPGKEEEQYYAKCLCWEVYPLNMTCSYLFLGRYPNRHEILFWFDFFGPNFMIGLYQAISVLLTFWATVIIMYYIQETIEEIDWPGIFLIILAFILWGFISFFLLPEAIRFLTLTTKVEQMKDRAVIEQVILNQKNRRALRSVKLYRQLKLIYREISNNDEVYDLPQKMYDLLQEAFYLVAEGSQNKHQINISQIDEVLTLCGVKLTEDELRVFAKECDPEDSVYISIDGFKRATSRIFQSSKLNPQQIARQVLRYYFQEYKNLRPDEGISIEDINDFLKEFSWHLDNDDINEFLWESRFLLDDQGTTQVREVAAMIRDDVESFPV